MKEDQQKREANNALEIRKQEIKLERSQLEQQTKDKEDRLKSVTKWMQEGKTDAQIEKLVKLIYG